MLHPNLGCCGEDKHKERAQERGIQNCRGGNGDNQDGFGVLLMALVPPAWRRLWHPGAMGLLWQRTPAGLGQGKQR